MQRNKENEERKESNRKKIGWLGFLIVGFCIGMAIWALIEAANANRSRFAASQSEIEARRQTYLAELSKQEAGRQVLPLGALQGKVVREEQLRGRQ